MSVLAGFCVITDFKFIIDNKSFEKIKTLFPKLKYEIITVPEEDETFEDIQNAKDHPLSKELSLLIQKNRSYIPKFSINENCS